jgi:CxxC-x17-CxxC domain-containing protein
VFTEAEQSYFATQGFTNPPKRCLVCRASARRRSARPGRDRRPPAGAPELAVARGPAGPHAVPQGPGAAAVSSTDPTQPAESDPAARERPARPRRAPGKVHMATCSVCATATEVPFEPDGVRPVYCLPCLKRRTR